MNTVPLKVSDYMVRRVLTVTADTEITRAVGLLIENDVSGLVVVDANGGVVGMLTERDCISTAAQSGYFDELGGPVSDFMSAPAVTVNPDENLFDVAIRFISTKYRRYPVVEDGRLVGIIARRDVLRALRRSSWFPVP